MTPDAVGEYDVINRMYVMEPYLYASLESVGTSGIRPVINLKSDVKFTGDGSYDNPYVIVTD